MRLMIVTLLAFGSGPALAQDTSAEFVVGAIDATCLQESAELSDIVAAGEAIGLAQIPLDNPNGVRLSGGGIVLTYAKGAAGLNCFLQTEGGDLVAYTKALQTHLPSVAEAAGANDYFESYPSSGSMAGGSWSWTGTEAFWTVNATGNGADSTIGVNTF